MFTSVLLAQDSQPLGDVARQLRTGKAKSSFIIECGVPATKQNHLLTQVTQPFSADYSITDKSGKSTGKLYFSTPKLREEITSAAEATNERDRKALEMLNFIR
ncbi:MAG TPA: hypothetical protein VK129_09915, partial [Terriglobales bacterium]|nr:hypothetical protein [Terriglobales bacterium]